MGLFDGIFYARVRIDWLLAACDPFSKKQTKHKVDKRHDEPPDLFEKKRKCKHYVLYNF